MTDQIKPATVVEYDPNCGACKLAALGGRRPQHIHFSDQIKPAIDYGQADRAMLFASQRGENGTVAIGSNEGRAYLAMREEIAHLKAEVERLRERVAELEAKPVLLARLSATASNPVSDSASIAAVTHHMSIVEQIEEQGRAILARRKKEER